MNNFVCEQLNMSHSLKPQQFQVFKEVISTFILHSLLFSKYNNLIHTA